MMPLLGGQEVTVLVPAGAQDGQIIHVPGSTDQPIDVVLTIAIQQPKTSQPARDTGSAGQSASTPRISLQSPVGGVVNPNSPTVYTSSPDIHSPAMPPSPPPLTRASRS